jgi:hypothetical protein
MKPAGLSLVLSCAFAFIMAAATDETHEKPAL